jgi:hypothetical protein
MLLGRLLPVARSLQLCLDGGEPDAGRGYSGEKLGRHRLQCRDGERMCSATHPDAPDVKEAAPTAAPLAPCVTNYSDGASLAE